MRNWGRIGLSTMLLTLTMGIAAPQSGLNSNGFKSLPDTGGIDITGRITGRPSVATWTLAGPQGRIAVDARQAIFRMDGRMVNRVALRPGSLVTVVGHKQGTVLRAAEVRVHRR